MFFVLPKIKVSKKIKFLIIRKKIALKICISRCFGHPRHIFWNYIYMYMLLLCCFIFFLFAIAYQTDVRDIVRSQISITKRLKVFPILHFCCRERKSGKSQKIETKKIRIPASIWIWMICGQDEREKIIKYILFNASTRKIMKYRPSVWTKILQLKTIEIIEKKSFVQSIWWRGFDRVEASQWKKGSYKICIFCLVLLVT